MDTHDDDQPRLSDLARDPTALLAGFKGSFWFRIGAASAGAYLERSQWLYRRVESIELVGRQSLRRKVSIDFERPRLPYMQDRAPRHGHVVPVSVFRKWPPLMDFSLTGPDGHSCSLYVRETNKKLDLGLLLGMTAALETDLSEGLQRLLALLVATDTPPAQAVEQITSNLRGELRTKHPRPDPVQGKHIADTISLAAQLANSSILWVPVVADRGTDCVVKFSYLDSYERLWHPRRILIAFSWHDRVFYIPLPHAGQHARYHLDVCAPNAAVEFVRAQTFAFPAEPAPANAPATPRSATTQARKRVRARRARPEPTTGSAQLGNSQIIDRRAHIYHPVRTVPSHRVLLQLGISATREGFLQGCLVAAVALAVLVSSAYVELPAAARHLDAFVVLLAAVPLVLGYLLVRSESPLEHEGVVGVRALSMLSGFTPIAAALVLVFSPQGAKVDAPDLTFARPVWAGLVMVSWLLVIGLAWSWALACSARDVSRAHRSSNIAAISGLLAAAGMTVGALLDAQPYSHLPHHALAHYLREHQARVLIAAIAIAVGAIALHPLLGGVRRVAWRDAKKGGRRATAALVMAAGALWIWGTIAAAAMTIWHSITLIHPGTVAPLMSTADTLANTTLAPAACLVLAASLWLMLRSEHLRASRLLLVLGASVGLTLVTLRAASVVSPTFARVSPAMAWLGFAFWIACVAVALRFPVGVPRPAMARAAGPG